MKLTVLEYLNRIPPNLCRMIARTGRCGHYPLTNEDIAKRSGLSITRVAMISKLKTWESVPVGQAEVFRTACGVTRDNEFRQVEYLKRTFTRYEVPLRHLARMPKKMLRRLSKGVGL